MPRALQCESCGKVEPEDGAVGWLEVSHAGVDVRRYDEDPGPWLLCGTVCLSAWAGGLDPLGGYHAQG